MAAPAMTSMEAALAERVKTLPPARAAALARFPGVPHRRMEAWKWTDLRSALREDLPPADNEVIAPSVFANAGPFEIMVMNGDATWGAAPAGVSVTAGDSAHSLLVSDHPMAALAAAFAAEALVIDIEGVVAQPILIRRVAGAGAVHACARLRLGPGAEATVIESFDGAGAFFSNSVIEYDIGAGAALTRIVHQNAGEAGVETVLATVAIAAAARLDQTALMFGGKMVRIETSVECNGDGARVSLRSAAALSASRHADATSLVAHRAPGGETRQLHRAALKDKSRGVFQGKFLVARGAQKTDAEMNAGALLLSDMAETNHKPELEIYADDVKCAHGSTAGALDDEAVFYMRQRGLSDAEARALLIDAFLGEVLDGGLPAGLAHILKGRLSRWLEGA